MANRQDRVLQYMKEFGSITSAECFTELGYIDLPKIICDLQDKGHAINKKLIYKINRYGDKTHFKRYSLAQEGKKE